MEAVRAIFWLEALRLHRGKKHPVWIVAFDLRFADFFVPERVQRAAGKWQECGRGREVSFVGSVANVCVRSNTTAAA